MTPRTSPSLCWLVLLYPRLSGRSLLSTLPPSSETPDLSVYDILLASISTHLRLLSLSKELIFPLLLLRLVPGEVAVFCDFLNDFLIHALQRHLETRSNDIASIHTPKWDTIYLEWTGDQEDTLRDVFEEDDTLAAEATGEEDEDRTRLERFPELGWTDCFADLRATRVS